jgi:hypothetical protein
LNALPNPPVEKWVIVLMDLILYFTVGSSTESYFEISQNLHYHQGYWELSVFLSGQLETSYRLASLIGFIVGIKTYFVGLTQSALSMIIFRYILVLIYGCKWPSRSYLPAPRNAFTGVLDKHFHPGKVVLTLLIQE